MKVCANCKLEKDFEDFYKRNAKSGGRHSICILCWKEKQNKKYEDDDLRKKNIRSNSVKHRNLARQFVFDYYRSHPCIDCGEKDPVVLELDHVRGNKIAGIAVLTRSGGRSIEKIKEEIDKCEVRCANCHRRKTAKEQNWYKDLIDDDSK